MEDNLFKSFLFQSIIVPVLFVGIGIITNRLGRKDGDQNPIKNLWAVGTSILLMSLVATISDLGRISAPDLNILVWVVVFLFTLLVSLDFDRYGSWERDRDGNITAKKHLVKGIIAPNLIGISLFIAYRATV